MPYVHKPLPDEDGPAIEETSRRDGEASRSVTGFTGKRTFFVTSAEPTTAGAAENAPGLPDAVGDAYAEGDSRVSVKRSAAPADGTGHVFAVTVEYEAPTEAVTSPLLRPDELIGGGSSETEEVFLTTDSTPKPIINKAKEPFEPLTQRTTSNFTFTVKGNRSLAQGVTLTAQMIQYLKPNAVNSDSVTVKGRTFAVGTLKMKNIAFAPATENGVDYEVWTWEFEGAPTWDLQIENRGYKQLVGGKQYDILASGTSTPVETPYPLNDDGTKKTNPDDVPSTLTFQIYPRKPFSVFNWTA